MNIIELRLQANDLDALARFYGQTLGLAILDFSHASVCIAVGASRLVFAHTHQAVPPYHVAFNVPEHLFAEAKAWLSKRCPLVNDASGNDEFNFENWNAHAVYFDDPCGNLLELIARHTLPSSADGKFGSHSLLCISEIGIVTDEPRITAQLARDKLGTSVYRGEPNDQFVPAGDEHGLLIIVARGRPWFNQETLRAEPGPVTVQIAGAPTFDLTPHARIIGTDRD